jgi:hypothetical protein
MILEVEQRGLSPPPGRSSGDELAVRGHDDHIDAFERNRSPAFKIVRLSLHAQMASRQR